MPRKKGTPNKLTGEVKELLADIVHREQDSMKEALREVYTLDKFKMSNFQSCCDSKVAEGWIPQGGFHKDGSNAVQAFVKYND